MRPAPLQQRIPVYVFMCACMRACAYAQTYMHVWTQTHIAPTESELHPLTQTQTLQTDADAGTCKHR